MSKQKEIHYKIKTMKKLTTILILLSLYACVNTKPISSFEKLLNNSEIGEIHYSTNNDTIIERVLVRCWNDYTYSYITFGITYDTTNTGTALNVVVDGLPESITLDSLEKILLIKSFFNKAKINN